MLIKKTIVLTAGVTVGYLTLVRVGESVGVKVILDSEPSDALMLGLRAGAKPQVNIAIAARRTESDVDIDLAPNDDLGAVIVDSKGNVVAVGGRKEMINVNKILPTPDTIIEAPTMDISEQTSMSIEEKSKESDINETLDSVAEIGETESEKADIVIEDSSDNITAARTDTEFEEEEIGSVGVGGFPPFIENKGENFYQNVRFKLEEIMTINPREETLEKLIPESKWVKVYYDDDEYYVVGVLTDDGNVTFLAYGVPGIDGIKPPKEAEELCDFLPLPDTVGEGYWLMFQNSSNGEMVKNLP